MSKRDVELTVRTEDGMPRYLLHVTQGELKRLNRLQGAKQDAMLMDLIGRQVLYGSGTETPRGILNT